EKQCSQKRGPRKVHGVMTHAGYCRASRPCGQTLSKTYGVALLLQGANYVARPSDKTVVCWSSFVVCQDPSADTHRSDDPPGTHERLRSPWPPNGSIQVACSALIV